MAGNDERTHDSSEGEVGDDADTIIRLIEPASPSRAVLADFDSLGSTRDVVDLATPAAPTPLWSVRIRGTTVVVPLDVPVVIGRAPGTIRVTDVPAPRRLVIPAGRRDVSGRHVRIEQLGHTLVVIDLLSTNGVVVHWSTGSRRRLRPGESTAVLPDSVIALGDGVELDFVSSPTLAASAPHTSESS